MTAAQRQYQRRRVARFRALGLTVRGTVRKLKQWPECRGLNAAEQKLLRQRTTREAFKRAGLTIHGKKRKNHTWPELSGLSGKARMNARVRICLRRYRGKQERRVLRLLITGKSLAVQLKRAA